jgi:PKHD-type hydroxylase
MKYDKIYNNPIERMRYTYSHTWWDGLFSDEELNKINEYVNTLELEDGKTIVPEGQEIQKNIRTSKIKFITPNEETQWFFNKFNWMIEQLNSQFYGFDLNGYDSIQYGVYEDTDNGKYDWHMDMILGNERVGDNMVETRKLSLSMLLNEPGVDFEGGEFQLNEGREFNANTIKTNKGCIIAFPSFMIHRVKPVTKGVRKSFVIWVMGPKFK